MKTSLLSAGFAFIFAAAVWADDPVPAPVPVAAPANTDRLIQEVQTLSDRLKSATDEIADLQKRLDAIEQRLGQTYRHPSPFDTMEKRLEDLEKDMDNLIRHR